jgi:quinol monooxygenase YgiN
MAKTPLNFIAHIKAKPGSEDIVRAACEACVAPTRAEAGNVNYDLHHSRDDQATFVLYEGWQSQHALDEHMRTPHFKALAHALEGTVELAPDGKPFTGEALTMLTERAGRVG